MTTMTLNLTKQIQANYAYLATVSAHVEKKKAEEKASQTPKQGA
jgi:hypothetical protein